MIYYYEQGYGTTRWYIERPDGKYLWIRVEGKEIAHGITTNSHIIREASSSELNKLIKYIFTKRHI
jgi:hypothetical protein